MALSYKEFEYVFSSHFDCIGFYLECLPNSILLVGMDYPDPKRKNNFVGKIILAAALTALCIIMLKQSPSFNPSSTVIP